MPNHSRIQATHTCQINIPNLPSKACEAHLFPNLAHALLSIGLLCNHGCTAIFDKQNVKITYKNTVILTGYRDSATNLRKGPSNRLHKHSLIQRRSCSIPSITPTVPTICLHKQTWSPTCPPPVEAPYHPHGSRPSAMATWPLGQA
jgi:hypothetical protein